MIDFESEEIEKRYKAVLDQAKKDPLGCSFLDRCAKNGEIGLATLFNYLYDGEIIHVTDVDKWLQWNGIYWESISFGDLCRAMQKVTRLLWERIDYINFAKDEDLKLEKTDDPAKIKENLVSRLESAQTKLLNARTIKSTIEMIDGTDWVPALTAKSEIFDRDPNILCVKNGIVVLKDGRLREANRDDYCTICAPVEWRGLDAPRPLWEKTVREILGGNEDVYNYFQRLLGMSLFGEVLEKNFLLLYGEEGDSGKTTIFEILFKVLGEYASPMPVELLLESGIPSNPNAPTPAIMDLRGKRLCWASEPGDNRRFSVDRIKLMSGGDTLQARTPYAKESIKFKPSHTLFMLSNNEPHAGASDSAFWKRLRQIDCPLEFVDNPTKPNQREVDRTLKDRILQQEAPGVLAWLVQGCINYICEWGTNPPECVLKATNEYRNREDKVFQFKEDCITERKGNNITGKNLYNLFKEWHEKLYGKAPSIQWFGKEAKKHFSSSRASGNVEYLDICLSDYGSKLDCPD